ncbi:MAG: serine O-acetyltransferase [Anaerolineales bacterium]|nr:serine O-acetyltransferase [Anaerolineae bacterium]PWB55854.1 MAG: serine O-acetyltransferase [Anaerolineales bacterium]
MLETFRQDVHSALSRDPAARSALEVILGYPGLHALWGYRIAHWFWRHDLKLFGRLLSQLVRAITGIEIHPGAQIGSGLFIDHGMGVVVGETAEIGQDVTLYHGVTLGGTSLEKGKRHPTLGDRVVVGAGAKILGPITIGPDSRIGANAVVVKSVPANAVVVGVPGQNIARSKPHRQSDAPDLNHTSLPDLVGVSLVDLIKRVEALEAEVDGHANGKPHVHAPTDGTWSGEDFSI